MAVVRRIERVPEADHGSLSAQLARLAKLHSELVVAEVRGVLITAAVAIAVALPAAVAIVAALIVLLAAAFAPLFGERWEHLALAGGGVAIASSIAIGWSIWRLRRLELPRETLGSLAENWEWLVAQLKSTLTLR
jgi:uncharacterized membrane protein YqjE